MNIVGIDPGLTGAIAYVTDNHANVIDMPTIKGHHGARMVDCALISEIMTTQWEYDFCIIEKPQWRHGNSAKSAMTTFFNYGRLTACFESWGEIDASVWKKQLGLSQDKQESLDMARELFPHLASLLERVKDHGRAEALLIAHWFKRDLN